MTDPAPTAGGRWFRVNTTWSQSEWLAVLKPAARLAWIELLGHVKAHGYDGKVRAVAPAVFGRMVGIPTADVRALLSAAEADGALTTDDGHWIITGWLEHQGDPTAKYRMQKYRNRNVTPVTRNNRNVTPTETETKTETKKKPPKSPKGDYPEDFNKAWAEYPTRAGSNSKADAFKAWGARWKEGATPAELLAGVKRYAAFCFATGKLRTEYVMQAKRFFGPAKPYAEPWVIPADGGRPKPGSQAAEIRDERPQADGPRLNRPSPAGADPLEERRRQERADDERVQHWQQQHPDEAKRIAAELRQEMEADPRWLGTPASIVEAAARGEMRRRILAQLGPRAA